MKIDVIGGSGFIGNKVCEILNENNIEFCILDKNTNPKFASKTINCDITNINDLNNKISGNTIINLAAVHRDDVRPKSLYDLVNVQGSKNICEVAKKKGISKIIFISSVAVYGFAPKNTYEDGKTKPFNDYGRTKLEAENVYREWYDSSIDNILTIVRPTVVFGENNRGNVYNFINQINKKYYPMIGDGENHKSMAYVNNVASFIIHALDFNEGFHIYNYIDKPDMDMNELITIVRTSLNKPLKPVIKLPYSIALFVGYIFDLVSFVTRIKFPISSIRIRKFCSDSQFGSSVIKSGFQAEFTLKEALKRTIEFEFIQDNSSERKFISE
tara:strand:- start:3999 stop:4982 length:984 start_codon:yes stop_codon:yes gene_type:complete